MSGKTIRVEVTAEDIDFGTRCSMDHCPVAHALNRAMPLPWTWQVGVGPVRAWFSEPNKPPASVLVLPRRAAKFVRGFDGGRPVEPFSFRIAR